MLSITDKIVLAVVTIPMLAVFGALTYLAFTTSILFGILAGWLSLFAIVSVWARESVTANQEKSRPHSLLRPF